MNVSLLDAAEQQKLLQWARQAIQAAVAGQDSPPISEMELTEGLRATYGAFVTLKEFGELRGCIGKMDFQQPLWSNTVSAAIASALEDPRFPPVTESELRLIRLEISVIEPPRELPQVELFDPQRHGIIVEAGHRHALLLPKVAQEYGWGAQKTLETVCLKAGLPPDAWQDPAALLQIFEAFDFGENLPAGQ